MFYPIIMAGGIGTRLWPLSRQAFPKQALQLVGDRTLIQHAVDRLIPKLAAEQLYVVAGESYVELLAAQVPELPRENFIVEPEGRGTAPAIGLAAIHLHQHDPQAVMAVLTADHYIREVERFQDALDAAQEMAAQNFLVTLGIKPTEPSTGYGYIQQGEHLQTIGDLQIFRADRFTEKPDADEAQRLFLSGNYAWNSGMFVWRVDRILEEFERQMPQFYSQLQSIAPTIGEATYEATLARVWPEVENETIDYGVMEGAEKVAVIPVEIGWSDVGSWASLLDVLPSDEAGNTVAANHIGIDTKDTLIVGNERTIATIGVEDLVIVDTNDALLVCSKEREQDVREMVRLLKEVGREDLL
jgi:mannose-1-phosphate guanylyltransferase